MNLKENIARMELELADMKKQLEQQSNLKLKGGEGWFIQTHYDPVGKEHLKDNSIGVTRGAFRATKELAKIADKNMVTRNRLEAHVHEIQGDGEGMHYVFFNKYNKMYLVSSDPTIHARLTEVYMQEETAEILCEALNNSEIEL